MDRLAEAHAHCQAIASRHYENFPVASLLLAARVRPAVAAVYAFARAADDFADEVTPEQEARVRPRRSPMPDAEARLADLREWRRRLELAAGGRPDADDHVFVALADAIARFDLPVASLHALLDAFEQDVTTSRHRSFEDLLLYCARSADPVGRLVLAVHGIRDEDAVRCSDRICTALQLTNFWQDVAVDARKDRVYLPLDDLDAHGVDEDDLFTGRVTPQLRRLLAVEVQRTRRIFAEGRPLLDATRGRLGLWLRLVWAGGHRILALIERNDHDVLTRRPRLRTSDWLQLAAASLAGRVVPDPSPRLLHGPAS